jgi:hypothetical protein
LRCRRVDASRVAGIVADLDTIFGLDAACRITGRARELCTPAYDESVPADPSASPAATSPAAPERLCFRVRCRKRSVAGVGVADRFGSRAVTLGAPTSICLPVTLEDEAN